MELRDLVRQYDQTEDDLKALQNVGQILGEVLKQIDSDRFIVKAARGPRYVVGCRENLDKAQLKAGTRIALDVTTFTIMRLLPRRRASQMVFNMLNELAGGVTYADIGGSNEQIRELREVIEATVDESRAVQKSGD